jgi:hypothetical protein
MGFTIFISQKLYFCLNLNRLPLFLFLLFPCLAMAQSGLITGNVLSDNKKAVDGATVVLVSMSDSLQQLASKTDKEGYFQIASVPFGYYRLKISYVGSQTLSLDSIHFRQERSDFNLSDITLKPANSQQLDEVIIYVEKPLIESKDGNITFNAGESAVAAGSNASDLLTSVPLVSKDPDGKITVRGKEPKILIDDKPVELNLQQLQDLLESLPGSSIEKIEVMTNPPPQYANEQGGVINIVTKKGRVGRTGRASISAGTRGEVSVNGNFTYRKQGFAISINAGVGHNRGIGEGHSERINFYADSTNYFNTTNTYRNKSWRPNLRVNLDYDFNKNNILNFVFQYNQNRFDNYSLTEYRNLNRFNQTYRLSERRILSTGESYSPSFTLTYTHKTKTAGEMLRVIAGSNFSKNTNDRDFFQQFFNPDHSPNGIDSTQDQVTLNKSDGYNVRVNYDKPLFNKKTWLNLGAFYGRSNSHIDVDAGYIKKPDGVYVISDPLSNEFKFHQDIATYRVSVRQIIKENFSVTGGTSLEQTSIWFELFKEGRDARNKYWTWLPFANINRNWKEKLNMTIAYRKSIRRPGINQLNPAIDFGDPYNIRFGNENLEASTAHNFDLVLGRTKPKYFLNLGLGYNIVQDIFSTVRTLLPDGKTQITWENISGRKEYEVSTWGGVTIKKKFRANISASYTYNEYSSFDKKVNRYRDGGSFTSNINNTYTANDRFNVTGSFTFNRFANPQGYARWSWSMNLGVQKKFFDKKMTVTFNIIDPFLQETRNFTSGPRFELRSYNQAQTRNFRLTLGYNFTKSPAKKSKQP